MLDILDWVIGENCDISPNGCACPCASCVCGCLGGDHSSGYNAKQADNRNGNKAGGQIGGT